MNIRENLTIPLSMLSISFLNESPFKGSYNGKRFMFEKSKKDDENFVLKLYIWKDLYSFEKTDIKDIMIKEFDYSKDGIDKGLDFIENFHF